MTPAPARVHLVGGGPDASNPVALVAPFAAEALTQARHHRRRPRIALVMADDTGRAADFRPAYVQALDPLGDKGFDYVDVFLDGSSSPSSTIFGALDGIVVAGGPTALYHQALTPHADTIRTAVAHGVPYLGFSAGAMIAASEALVGGWQDNGRQVCDEGWSEGLTELQLEPGLGLVDLTVDVHATQGGLLGRALAVAARSEGTSVVAIDEATTLSVPLHATHTRGSVVAGAGFVWVLQPQSDGQVAVSRTGG